MPSKYFNYLTYKAHKSMPFGFEMCKKGLILLSYQVKFQNITQNRLHLFSLMLQFSLDTLYCKFFKCTKQIVRNIVKILGFHPCYVGRYFLTSIFFLQLIAQMSDFHKLLMYVCKSKIRKTWKCLNCKPSQPTTVVET